MKINREILTTAGILIIIAVTPLIFHENSYTMHLLIMSMIWAVAATAWDLLLGYGGIFNLAQVGFFAIGAYATGMASIHLGISPWMGLLLGAVASGLAGVLIGLPCLRLKGIYVALMTLAFFEVIGPLIVVGINLGTGGKAGLFPIPPFRLGSYVFNTDELLPWYYLCLILLAICLFITYKLIHSMLGLSFTALRDSEPFAQSLGINRFKSALVVTAIAAAMTGLIGAFYAHYVVVISPRMLGLDMFLFLLIMIIFGGAARFPGPVIGAFVITFLDDMLRPLDSYRLLAFGALMVIMIMLLPNGLMGLVAKINIPLFGKRDTEAEMLNPDIPKTY
ncbi:MAG: branched-chain amino acid ABC transporter permease [Desulfobacterales bacterium]|nr:branched-chain amino acid ABC transporter permease [Desulfobacterales bacterium]